MELPCQSCLVKVNCSQVCDKLKELELEIRRCFNSNPFYTKNPKFKELYYKFCFNHDVVLERMDQIEKTKISHYI